MSSDTTRRRRAILALQGALAAAVATAVLLGGFGAFALWNDSIDAGAGGSINTGTLDLVRVENGLWTLERSDGVLSAGDSISIDSFKASPGDLLQYAADVIAVVDGDDVLAELTLDPTTYSIDPDLENAGVTVTVSLNGAAPNGPNGGFLVASSPAEQTLQVTVLVDFPYGIPGQVGQGLTPAVSLDGLSFMLTQLQGPSGP